MKKVYICHEFGGKSKNKKKIGKLIKSLIKEYPDLCFLSPVHNFGFYYRDVEYLHGIEYCLTLLKTADVMWTFGDRSESMGCLYEKAFCNESGIPVVERANDD